jgi:hypothetical protein
VNFDTFAMVVSFINTSSEPTHVTIGNFEIHNIASVAMVNQVKVLLDSFALFDKIIVYIKDEKFNISTLTSMVSCSTF